MVKVRFLIYSFFFFSFKDWKYLSTSSCVHCSYEKLAANSIGIPFMMKYFSLATFSLSLTFNIFYYEVPRCGSLCSLPLWSLCSFLVYRLVRFIKFSNFMASNFSTPFFPPVISILCCYSLYTWIGVLGGVPYMDWCAWWCAICFWGSINVSLFFAFSSLEYIFSTDSFWSFLMLFSANQNYSWVPLVNFDFKYWTFIV